MKLYYQTHFWWDAEDREYMLTAVWRVTDDPHYGGQYASEELLDIEMEFGAPEMEHEMCKGSDVWRSVESDGFKHSVAMPLGEL